MTVDKYDFGTITIDGKEYTKDVVIHSVELITQTTPDAITHINDQDTNLVLHLT